MSEKFEAQIKSLLDDVQVEPREAVWQHVRQEIRPEKRRRRFVFWWILPVALAGGGLWYFLQQDDSAASTAEITRKTDGQNDNAPNDNANKSTVTVTAPREIIERSPAAAVVSGIKGGTNVSTPARLTSRPANSINKQSFAAKAPAKRNDKQEVATDVPADAMTNITIDNTSGNSTATDIPPVVAFDPPVTAAVVDSSATVKTLILDSSIATDVKSPVKVPVKTKWRFGVKMDIGLAGKSDALVSMAKSAESVFSTGGSGPTSVTGASIRQENSVKKGPLYGLGMIAEKDLGKNFTWRSSLSYQHQSFSAMTERYKDSLTTSGMLSLPWYKATDKQALHLLNVSTGFSVRLYNNRDMKLALAASFDNFFVIVAKTQQALSLENGSASIANQSMVVTNGYRTWQPHLGLSLPVDFFTKQPGRFQVSPYLNYGLRPSGTSSAGNKKHLSSFGISTIYFFK